MRNHGFVSQTCVQNQWMFLRLVKAEGGTGLWVENRPGQAVFYELNLFFFWNVLFRDASIQQVLTK